MRFSNPTGLRRQVRFLRRQFLQDGELPFTDILSAEMVTQALSAAGVAWKDRIYTPLVTLWVFLSQVLSADHSCRGAVARLIAYRTSQGQAACSARASGYCQARKRLPEKFFSRMTCLVGRTLDAQADPQWLWKGRNVYMFDGTTITMPDTAANQKVYPQNPAQKKGLGFPIARVGALISLSCGVVMNLGICRYAGKGQGEVSLLRQLWDILRPGDVLLGDRLLANWTSIHRLQQRGIHLVSRLNKAHRKADFRKGIRLGKEDHLIGWRKPPSIRSVSKKTYRQFPDYIFVREARIRVSQPGFRSRSIVIVTTFLDPTEVTKQDLAFLYRARWHNELDLRSIKIALQMDRLRCKTPELVRKEIWAHILAYNLIRTIMAQAAIKHDLQPRTISFTGALQTLEAFQPAMAVSSAVLRKRMYHTILDAVATHRVGDRPNRFEPRLKKRRHKRFAYLSKPRNQTKRDMIKRVRNI